MAVAILGDVHPADAEWLCEFGEHALDLLGAPDVDVPVDLD